jgi:hypothetical protein
VNSPNFPPLNPSLLKQLSTVQRTDDLYYPCCATLVDGREVDCVYLSEASSWFWQWGVWPRDDEGKRSLDLKLIVSLRDSPSRLPAKFAQQLYSAGESGMGYTIFTVEFLDGSKQAYQSGNAIDFVRYPLGQKPETVARVHPHEGRWDDPVSVPNYYWCLYGTT